MADLGIGPWELGAIDQLRLHLVPVILGAGTRLFSEGPSRDIRLRPTTADATPLATHLAYEVERAASEDNPASA